MQSDIRVGFLFSCFFGNFLVFYCHCWYCVRTAMMTFFVATDVDLTENRFILSLWFAFGNTLKSVRFTKQTHTTLALFWMKFIIALNVYEVIFRTFAKDSHNKLLQFYCRIYFFVCVYHIRFHHTLVAIIHFRCDEKFNVLILSCQKQ